MTTAVDLDDLTLHGAMLALERGDLSTVELMRATLVRIEESEPALHAWVEVGARLAMEYAAMADRRRRIPRPPAPLLGLPIGVKDIFDVAGKPTRCNSALREDAPVAARDSAAVHALRRDGAIILGKTVTQEFAAGVISDPARNPWDPDRIPGGSSGGSAAAVAAGSCLGALGSDTGGSIRIPASVTGTVGLKPTYGRLSTKGVFPLSPSLDTVGPIARTVIDAAILYLSLADRTAEIAEVAGQLIDARSLAGRRIGVLTGYFDERMQPAVAAAFGEAVDVLRRLGAEVVACAWPEATAARAAALLISRAESATVHRDAIRTSPDLIRDDVRARLEVGATVHGADYLHARRVREVTRDAIAALYADHALDAIAAPTLPATAPRADDPVVRYPDGSEEPVGTALTRFTTPWNATGQPVVALPCGFDGDGLPIGLSLVGRPDAELDLCALAHAYEQATEWHMRRPPT